MTMYLPNPDVHPTGSEPAEFLEIPAMAEQAIGEPGGPSPLDPQTRIGIASRVRRSIVDLVESHHGDREDVRAIVHDLYRSTFTDDSGDL